MARDVDAGGRPQKRYYNREMGHTNNHARKEKKTENFPHIQYKKIEMGSVAKSYMRKGFPIYE
jgi:hypothetical protein